VIVAICAVYVVLGTAMEERPMISSPCRCSSVVTAPRFDPICSHHHRDRRADRLISPPWDEHLVVKSLLRH